MSDQPKLYIAGIGMITPVGFDTASTAAAVKAGVSGYQVSDYYGHDDEPITMAMVPNKIFFECDADIGEGSRYNERHDRVIKMAITAIREACANFPNLQNVPAIFAMPEEYIDDEGLSSLLENLENNCAPWINTSSCRKIHNGRASGIEAINLAYRYLDDLSGNFVLIGGSDSYHDDARLQSFIQADRLLKTDNMDGFAPGEASGFILLTCNPKYAMQRDGYIIALFPPGIAEEEGHLGSEEPYRGNGLDLAFKNALEYCKQKEINTIYSSMNGENFWAKEYSVAYSRNKNAFIDSVRIEHPAEYIGDAGSATGTVLIGLAVSDLIERAELPGSCLVYGSSDGAKRSAVVIEKVLLSEAS